ncbi:GTP-binding SAR1 [Fusarium albosuccineum]|uniref:GTP-binding SAR1 n=1 Tax=Fusarium albosuccineum TaxID=1237068 RepID=A0A8H4L960_9HYPO|nr:GTP-binding SAR1 [Fusarium albosuccineum]
MTTNNPDTPWVAPGSEDFEEADEPPELTFKKQNVTSNTFQRTAIRASNDKSSLLTKAIMGQSEDDIYNTNTHVLSQPTWTSNQRRRSLASNISLASTADLTSDTGFTSPSRPSTPSPPLPEMGMLRLNDERAPEPKPISLLGAAVKLQVQSDTGAEAPRKRSIQFACGGKPVVQDQPLRAQPMVKTPSAQEAPRRPCIKFACPARPASTQNTPPRNMDVFPGPMDRTPKAESPSTPKRSSTLSLAVPAPPHPIPPRRHSMSRPKFLRADSSDLVTDSSQFHEFASGTTREDDWIRRVPSATGAKLTINDTLVKENHIRRLATEAEEEAEEEEEELNNDEEDVAFDNDDEDEDDDDEEELDIDLDDEEDEDEGDEDDDSDGYHTDEETGFADSEEEDDDENMALWTPGVKSVVHIGSGLTQIRRPSLHERQSDSSITTLSSQRNNHREKPRRVKHRDETPDLPDSTDFVCGTLDEDRPLEEAYLSCLAARRNEKLRVIPQDIDPSFPASEPEDENEAEIFNPVHHESDEDDFLHGQMEDLHHERERDRPRRRRKSELTSPKRFRSPPPKRHYSPPPKIRGRSPKPLFDRHSPRKAKSPAPARKPITTPLGSPRCGQVKFNLAGRPGLTHTKSLPRAGAMCQQRKQARHKFFHHGDIHVRGAIDIVKGLESKRQRRKEKFHQKYCNRARRGQIPERKPIPGRGTERMRELGLLMAGKKDQGNYVISV